MILSDIVKQLKVDRNSKAVAERLCNGRFFSISRSALGIDSEF